MNLRDLEYFVAVAELGHFGKAAERCFCTQPTLSGQLKKLEEELGSPLLERLPGGGIRLTEFGEVALVHAHEALVASRRIADLGKASRDPYQGDLVLAAIPTIGPWLWPKAIPALHAEFPNLSVFLREEQTAVLLRSLRDGSVDLGILALPVEGNGLEAVALWDEPFLLATPEGHELSGRGSMSVRELSDLDLLLLEDGHCLRDQALEVCRAAGAREREGFRATSLESLRQMVRSGIGLTLLPAGAASPETGIGLVAFDQPPTRTVGIVWRKGHPRSRAIEGLARILRTARPF